MPDVYSADFAKSITEKIRKSEYFPPPEFAKKNLPKRQIVLKPYLLKEESTLMKETEKENEKGKKLESSPQDYRKKIQEKLACLQNDLSILSNEVNLEKVWFYFKIYFNFINNLKNNRNFSI